MSKLQEKKITTGRPTKQDSFYIVVKNVFFHNLLGCLIPDNNKNIIKESYYSKINFNVKHIWEKDFLNEINCKQPSISNIVYG